MDSRVRGNDGENGRHYRLVHQRRSTMTPFVRIAGEKKTKLWRTNISRFVIKKGQKSFPWSVYDDQLNRFCFRHS
jgi:hypothetical protein